MKAVIIAKGSGTTFSEDGALIPKIMVKIGEKPMLWHIMKSYSCYGINDFIICCGYKSNVIREYFANYHLNNSDVTFRLRDNTMELHSNLTEPWNVTLVNTSQDSTTGGQLKKIKNHIGDQTFCMTYGNALSDVNIRDLISFHRSAGLMATLIAVQHTGRSGMFHLKEQETKVNSMREKLNGSELLWTNGGYFVLEPEILDYIEDEENVWEKETLEGLSGEGQLSAYRHTGFWKPMDTLNDKNVLEKLWQSGTAPWHEHVIKNQYQNLSPSANLKALKN
ncbi:MAG: glucose-1-phosphate cytidylyltransferase [Pedobacter sp.]